MTSRHKSKNSKLAKPVRQPAARKPPEARKTIEAAIQNVEVADQSLQSGATSVEENTEGTAHHYLAMGISGDEPQPAPPPVIRTPTTDVFRQWLDFAHDRQEKNLAGIKTLMQCRTPLDIFSLQYALMRDYVEGLRSYGRLVSGY
jgi:hypothetical protein